MSDSRFSALSKDPRYRLPSKKEARTSVDPRFGRLFTDQEFRKNASVDRYGRKIKPEAGKKELERLYRLDKEEKPKAKGGKKVEREVVGSSDESEEEEESAEEEEVVAKRDPARDGGFSESSSSEEETSDEESEDDEEAHLADETAGAEQTEDIPMGEVSRRIACVNLDWDNIRAADLMAVASSFAPSSGKIESVTIYPSEFGKERLQREEVEGPPREIFASSKQKEEGDDDEDDDDEEEDSSDDEEKIKEKLLKDQAEDGAEFDTAKLRQYQLERLRYYYAVIECSNNVTAKTLYDTMDGREYLSTSNFFDLRFVPDDTSFDDDNPHEECLNLPTSYKPNDFRTEALTHSKVRLTWDDDDATRKEVQKRAFSRAEMDENDLQAYIGSDESDADSVSSRVSTADRKRKAKAAKMREALGLSLEPTSRSKSDKDEVVGNMQVTFTSGLSAKDGKGKGVFENEPQDEESTRARYIRKEKERKQKRKEKMKQRGTAESSDDEAVPEEAAAIGADEAEDDDPFNDPFFNDPVAAAKVEKSARKADKEAKRAARAKLDAEAESRRAELELLMADEDKDVTHFDMREIEKAEKEARRKGKGKKKGKKDQTGDAPVVDEFKVETEDPRFKALFESHEYAIDPTNPKFKKTKGMETLLEEGRKKRKVVDEDEDGEHVGGKKSKKAKQSNGAGEADDVRGLVARLKNKSKSKAK